MHGHRITVQPIKDEPRIDRTIDKSVFEMMTEFTGIKEVIVVIDPAVHGFEMQDYKVYHRDD
jgi:hypothetical protein